MSLYNPIGGFVSTQLSKKVVAELDSSTERISHPMDQIESGAESCHA